MQSLKTHRHVYVPVLSHCWQILLLLFPSITFLKNSDFVLYEFLKIIDNSRQLHEQHLIILVKFFRTLQLFLTISDVVLGNKCINS